MKGILLSNDMKVLGIIENIDSISDYEKAIETIMIVEMKIATTYPDAEYEDGELISLGEPVELHIRPVFDKNKCNFVVVEDSDMIFDIDGEIVELKLGDILPKIPADKRGMLKSETEHLKDVVADLVQLVLEV